MESMNFSKAFALMKQGMKVKLPSWAGYWYWSKFQEAPVDAKPLWFLGKSLELLAGADIAYFAKGWQDARGCKIENTCAIEYGIPVIEDYTAD